MKNNNPQKTKERLERKIQFLIEKREKMKGKAKKRVKRQIIGKFATLKHMEKLIKWRIYG